MPNSSTSIPRLAVVRPCFRGPTGEKLMLTEVAGAIERAAHHGSVALIGGPGSGKTTALEHLAASFAGARDMAFLDEPSDSEVTRAACAGVVFYTRTSPPAPDARSSEIVRVSLVPWGVDEWIEYLLAKHKHQCASVMRRLRDAERAESLCRLPLFAAIILDEMAADEGLADPAAALARFFDARVPPSAYRSELGLWSIHISQGKRLDPPRPPRSWRHRVDPRVAQCMRQAHIQYELGSERAFADVRSGQAPGYFASSMTTEMVEKIGFRVAREPSLLVLLQSWVADRDQTSVHATAASILHSTRSGWRPADDTFPNLSGAYLSCAHWPGARLKGIRLQDADLSFADLTEACLDNSEAGGADFANAILHAASLRNIKAANACFEGADLSYVRASHAVVNFARMSGANLEGALLENSMLAGVVLESARLVRANLAGSHLAGAKLEDADLTAANLKQADLSRLDLRHVCLASADLSGATLVCCNLEYQQIGQAVFQKADLTNALLTGSSIPSADMRGARLVGAGLADIDWPDADLRGADLRGASFHTGSSRSGLVGSPIASEGSRTGFYTDEFEEQSFQAPDAIRKANLRGADLRGAKVAETDFYLVDLRDALYDPDQEEHFRRCRAILESRVED